MSGWRMITLGEACTIEKGTTGLAKATPGKYPLVATGAERIRGKTAAEIIHDRADSTKRNTGLTSWRGDKPRKQDVVIAKTTSPKKSLDR